MRNFCSKDLIVTDDPIPMATQRQITSIVQGPIWQYGWRSNVRRDRFCFWHARFAGGGIDSRKNCEQELRDKTALAPIYQLWKSLEAGVLEGHEPLRVYANGHTFGVEGYVHVDNEDTDNYFSTIYYAHPAWHKNWW